MSGDYFDISELARPLEMELDKLEGPLMIEFIVEFSMPNFKLEIFAKEHGVPHFRVTHNRQRCNYAIKDCTPIKGQDPHYRNARRTIYKWWAGQGVCTLIFVWNETRPDKCQVGIIPEIEIPQKCKSIGEV